MPMGGTPVTLVPDGTSGATSAGIVTVGQLPAAAAGADATANPTSSQVFAANELFNGTTWDRQRAAGGTIGIAAVNTEGTKATYRFCTTSIVGTANGVLFSIGGSASKTVKITRVSVSGALSTAAPAIVGIYRTTGAVSAASNAVVVAPSKMVSTNAAVPADVAANSYTTSTIGAGSVLVGVKRALFGGGTVAPAPADFSFGDRNGQALTLVGVAEFMQVFLNTASWTGASIDFDVELTLE